MAADDSASCGTGGGNFPQAGDPNLADLILSANSGFGGIAVSWSYPSLNPHAMAHTLVFRNTVNVLESAATIATIGGNYYFDQATVSIGTTYYYWIQPVSVNGTVGDVIGPASAGMQPSIEAIIDLLVGRISKSELAADLKADIGVITNVSSSLDTETQERLLGAAHFDELLLGYQAQLDDVDTLVVNETLERTNGDEAVVAQVDLIFAQSNDNAAAILKETAVRVTGEEATALSIETVQATLGDATSSIQTLQEVTLGPNGLVSEYMVKVDADGYTGGVGIYNDGETIDMILLTDNFAIGKPGATSKYPFIIGDVNGETQIVLNARTLIPDGHIGNAMISGYIQSNDYNGTDTGWRIDKDADAWFGNVYARGDIEATTLRADVAMVGEAHIIDASIKTAHIDELQVDTLQLANQAVTIPSSAYTASSSALSTSWVEKQSVSYTSTGNPTDVELSSFFTVSDFGGDCQIRLLYDGAVVHTFTKCFINTSIEVNGMPYSFSVKHLPVAGVRTYSIEAKNSGGASAVEHVSLKTLEVKR